MASLSVLTSVLLAGLAPVALGNTLLSGLLHSLDSATREHFPFQDEAMVGGDSSNIGIYHFERY